MVGSCPLRRPGPRGDSVGLLARVGAAGPARPTGQPEARRTGGGRDRNMWCPSCGDEFREGVTHCPDCGVELVSDEVVPRATEPHRQEIPKGYDLLVANWEGPGGEFIEWLDDESITVLTVASHEPGLFDL